ncbi:hypothetical protein MN116_002999 [Schistosoma mekongi]|uniref:Ig-like domain-containing protein n=1 Tax=Schistosoma mekongi TaxID=38744 RepID=A0AAE1ZI24_SCHME|nr:hypothetical protein MN116_002999 [Schistosoma mekongi]
MGTSITGSESCSFTLMHKRKSAHSKIPWIRHKNAITVLTIPIINILNLCRDPSTYCCIVVHALAVVTISGNMQLTIAAVSHTSEFTNPAVRVAPAVKTNKNAAT